MKKVLTVLIVAVAMFLSQGLFISQKDIVVSANVSAEKDFVAQVFYIEEDGVKMSETTSVKQQVVAGDSVVNVALPIKHIQKFRFDFGVQPGHVTISDLQIAGNNTLNLDMENFIFSPDVTKHEVIDGKMSIVSDNKDPYMIYKDVLDVDGATSVNWLMFILLLVVYGFVSYKLVGYFYKKK